MSQERLELSKNYFYRGWHLVRLKPNTKRPHDNDFYIVTLTEADLPVFIRDNVGVGLGHLSNGLTDIDVDDEDALKLADHFLPQTGMEFGRKSSPRCHRLYEVADPGPKVALKNPTKIINPKTGKFYEPTLVEVRGDGCQTMFPGSMHPEGELIEWVKFDQAAKTTRVELIRKAKLLSAATLIYKNWGSRHDIALAVAGVMFKGGYALEQTQTFIQIIAGASGDREEKDRLRAVEDTYANAGAGKPIAGYQKLIDNMTEAEAKRVMEWLGVEFNKATGESFSARDLKSDAEGAKEYVARHDGQTIYVDEIEEWFTRDRQVFTPSSKAVIQGQVMSLVNTLEVEWKINKPSAVRRLQSRAQINAIVELSRSLLKVNLAEIDNDLQLLGCSDGSVLALDKQAIDAKAIVTKRLGVAVSAGAQCPVWEKFLNTIFANDREVIRFIQRAVGYSLTGKTVERCMFILIGIGDNGKSTLLKVIGKLFGDYGGVTPMHSLMVTTSTQTDDLANLVGKRFVSAAEGETSQKLAGAKVKQMTGGDTINCRLLHHNAFSYSPQFKLWLATNELPSINGSDNAIWTRIRVIKFPVSIPKKDQDTDLPAKLEAELAGILNWALTGYEEYRRIGLAPPVSVINVTQEYRNDNDSVGEFIKDCCVCASNSKVTTKLIYTTYKNWCENSGIADLSKVEFGRVLGRKGFTEDKGHRYGRGWIGLQLREATTDEVDDLINSFEKQVG